VTVTGPSLQHEIDDLILEQVHAFKEPNSLSVVQIFEYHLRHRRLIELFRELDSFKTGRMY
jgi:hypothetical protein